MIETGQSQAVLTALGFVMRPSWVHSAWEGLMRCLRIGVLGLSLLAVLSTGASAKMKQQTDRQRAEEACFNDVQKLCPNDIPNESKIKVCMAHNRSKLSPGCRQIFDAGVKG